MQPWCIAGRWEELTELALLVLGITLPLSPSITCTCSSGVQASLEVTSVPSPSACKSPAVEVVIS